MKKVLTAALTACLLAFSAGCAKAPVENPPASAPGATTDNKAQIVLKLGDVHPEDYPTVKGDKEFARLVEERSNGKIKIEVFASKKLGEETDVIEQVKMGIVDFTRVSVSPVTKYSKNLNVLLLPYIYRDPEHMWKVLDGSIGDELLKSLEENKLTGLCFYDSGSRNFYNNKKEIKSVADIKGLKLRVQNNKLMQDLVTMLGAVPQNIELGKIKNALETGEIDGAENNFSTYFTQEHYKAAKFIVKDAHSRIPEITIASLDKLSKLSPEDQELIKKAARDSEKLEKEEWAKMEKDSEDKVKAGGAVVTELDEKAKIEFKNAVSKIYDTQGKDYADLIKRISETK